MLSLALNFFEMKQVFWFIFIAVFFSSCSFGAFVKVFHIKGQHKIPTYSFSGTTEALKKDFEKLFKTYPKLILKDGNANNYIDGTYFAEIDDSISKNKIAIRFGFYEESELSVIKIFSIKYNKDIVWKAFFSHKIKRKEMLNINKIIVRNIFNKINGISFCQIH